MRLLHLHEAEPHARQGCPLSAEHGKHLLELSFSHFDPFASLAAPRRPRLTLYPSPFQSDSFELGLTLLLSRGRTCGGGNLLR